jgi:hypothetical protein
MVCALCGRRFVRALPFHNHEVMCRQAHDARMRRQLRHKMKAAAALIGRAEAPLSHDDIDLVAAAAAVDPPPAAAAAAEAVIGRAVDDAATVNKCCLQMVKRRSIKYLDLGQIKV